MKLIYATLIFLALATLAHAQAITDILLSVAGEFRRGNGPPSTENNEIPLPHPVPFWASFSGAISVAGADEMGDQSSVGRTGEFARSSRRL